MASSSPELAAAEYVLAPQARLRMCQPVSSISGFGYMVLSPDTLSFPQAHNWSPIMQQKEEVVPAATCHPGPAALLQTPLSSHLLP